MVRRTLWILPVLLIAVILARGGYAEKSPQDMETTIAPRDRGAPAGTRTVPAPRYTEDERELLAIQEDGKKRVQDLVARIRTAVTREDRLSLEREVETVKRETRLRLLEKHMDLALASGDRQRLEAARLQIERLTRSTRIERTPVHRDPPAAAIN